MGGWTAELHARGLRSGIYAGASSGINQMYWYVANNTGFIAPDDIWIASWRPCSCYESNATVFDASYVRPYVPDGYWFYNQRLYQYAGDHYETWGSAQIFIDSDCASGEVLGPFFYFASNRCGAPYQ
jgi:hypothetical protein